MKIIIGLLTLIGVVLTPVSLISGEDEMKIGRLYKIKAHPGKSAEFGEALLKHIEWRREANDPWSWWAWQVVNGDELGTMYFYSGEHAWSDLDAYEDFEGGDHFNATVGPLVAEASSMIDTVDEDISHWHPEPEKVQYISVIQWQLKPGAYWDFKEIVGKYHKLLRDNDHPGYYGFNWTVNGGAGDMVTLLIPYEDWADMAPPEETMQAMLFRVLGKEEAMKLDKAFSKTIASTNSMIVKFIPELSVVHEE
ncbi:MAG: hypothetical protein AB3N63_11990 [Puniceicoccaceae bacterium]